MRNLLIIALFFIAASSFAQQGLITDFTEQDSAQMRLQRQIEYYQLISGHNPDPILMTEKIELPDFNEMAEIYDNRYSFNLDYFPLTGALSTSISQGMTLPNYSPFYMNGKVLSAAAYRINDKFTFGGFSYGVNSVFSAPLPNQGLNSNFDAYGSTLFLKYKVSKKFKIETRINVQQNGNHPGF